MKTRIDLRELKSRHRLELVMKETGEVFDESGPVWKSTQRGGLLVDLEKQSWQLESGAGGDVFEWLKYRYGWAFVMCLRYLQARKGDGYSPAAVSVVKPVEKPRPVKAECVRGEPVDRWQEKALDLAGDEIRPFFSPYVTDGEIMRARMAIPSRYLAMVDFLAGECVECGYEFDWLKPGEVCYLEEHFHYGGEDVPEEERALFFLDNGNLSDFICEGCKQKKARYYLAMEYCLCSAQAREQGRKQAARQELGRLEALARQGSARAHDAGDSYDVEYLVNRAVVWQSLAAVGATDDQVLRAFSRRPVYEFLTSGEAQSAAAWARVIGVQV